MFSELYSSTSQAAAADQNQDGYNWLLENAAWLLPVTGALSVAALVLSCSARVRRAAGRLVESCLFLLGSFVLFMVLLCAVARRCLEPPLGDAGRVQTAHPETDDDDGPGAGPAPGDSGF